MNTKDSFMQYVELHERAWGMDKYTDRPSLQQLLTAPVVAFWYLYDKRESRYVASLHKDMAELNTYISQMVVHNGQAAGTGHHPCRAKHLYFPDGRA